MMQHCFNATLYHVASENFRHIDGQVLDSRSRRMPSGIIRRNVNKSARGNLKPELKLELGWTWRGFQSESRCFIGSDGVLWGGFQT